MVAQIGTRRRVDWIVSELEVAGGAERMVIQCAPRLRAAGWEIKVITLAGSGEMVKDLQARDVPVVELGLERNLSLVNITKLMSIWSKDRPDLLHTHLFHAGILGRSAAKVAGLSPVVVHQHGPEMKRSRLRSFLDRSTTRWVTIFVASCQAVSEIMRAREGIPGSQIEVIYNGVEYLYEPHKLNKNGIPGRKDIPTLVYSGRLSPEKGLITLVQALAVVYQAGLPYQCLLVGEGSARQEIEQEIRRLGLEEVIFLLGRQDDVRALLKNCDVFILPSIWEGASLALLEAMAAGLPVVATSTGGTPELVDEGVTGILVPPSDSAALATAIERLLGSSELRKQMGAAGSKRVNEKFRIERTVDQISALYAGLLG